jgi:hypothetical protein
MLLHITRTSYQKYSSSYHLRKRMYTNSNLNFLPQQTDGNVNASMSMKAKVRKLQEVMKENEEEEEEGNPKAKADNTPMNKWDQVWKEEITPWDLGRPTPLLASELIAHSRGESAHFIPKNCKTVKVLVPGCGSGYDLNTIREYLESLPVLESESCTEKTTVVGLEISETSLNNAQQRLCAILERSWSSSGKKDLSSSTSKTIAIPDVYYADCVDIQLKLGDFFDPCDKWSHHCSMNTIGVQPHPQPQLKEQSKLISQTFDFIYDYTFFCALPPAARGRWGERMSSLLKPKSGRLLTIMYPILDGLDCSSKALRGPPYPVTVDDYKRALEPHGFYITEGPYVHDDTVESRKGQEYVCWWGLDDEKMRGPPFSFL